MKRLSIIIFIVFLMAGPASGFTISINPDTLSRDLLIKIDPFRLQIISPSSGVQFYRNGIVYLSHSKSEEKMPENHISFGKADAYFVVYDDTTPGNPTLFSPSTSFEVPCEAMTFSNDFSVMYYTKKPSGKDPEKIYRARYQATRGGNREWVSDPKPLNFCNDKSLYSHPALSADGEIMVFTSNRRESIGGLDLFITRRNGTSWSAPENAGNILNTSGNEFSPFLDQDNNLFFSSDGHKGFGGYDIFFCRFNGSGWEKPANLTEKINSDKDEIAFTLNRTDGKSAFFTRKIRTGKRTPQLFRISFRDKIAANEFTNLSNALNYLALGNIAADKLKTTAAISNTKANSEAQKTAQTPLKTEAQPDKSTAAEQVMVPVQPQGKSIQSQTAAVQKPPELPNKQVTQPQAGTDVVVYRVQFSSTDKPRGSFEMTIAGNKYQTYEYLYNGLYRSCAGEFKTRAPASVLQRALMLEGFSDAFVVAFKNNVRSLDPALFK